MQVYVLSAVPPRSNRYLQKYGLLSGVEIIKHPDVLKAARPDAKQRKAFVKKVKEVIASDFPHSVMGPSVFFTTPDPDKITDKHFIKQWDLQTIRIDLSRLVEDYPDTVVWGAELLPYDYAWRKMSDEEFEDEIAELGFSSWEEYRDARSRPLTLDEVYDFTQADPVELWEHYHKSDIGKKYASNVPHAFIITPMGYIPYEYIEYVDNTRSNPSPNVMYHGSPNLFSKFEPRPHYLTDGKPVVFATPMREIALASLQPWTDDDFEQGVVGEDPPYMIEMYPNAFEDVYSGKQGYLYTLAPDSFYSTDQLTRFEKVSDIAPRVLDVELVENVLEELYASNMLMIPYEHGSAFRSNDYRMRENPEDDPYVYLLNCTDAYFEGGEDVIHYINDHQEWSMDFSEFAELVDLTSIDDLEVDSDDWGIDFFESKLPSGQKVYVIRHSHIEYIFVPQGFTISDMVREGLDPKL